MRVFRPRLGSMSSPALYDRIGGSYTTTRREDPRIVEAEDVDEIVWFGYSGGGALAVLLALRFPQSVAVITVAANLDIDGWCCPPCQPSPWLRSRLSTLSGTAGSPGSYGAPSNGAAITSRVSQCRTLTAAGG